MLGEQSVVTKEPPNFKVTKTVGLISDTHVPKRARAIPNKVFEIFDHVDYIIHAGDLVEIAVLDELEQLAPVLAVHGNMDNMEVSGALPRTHSLKIFDWKLGVMHDPGVMYSNGKMREIAKQNEFNVFVYGHTHVANVKWEGKTLYINPGSPTVPELYNRPSVGMLKITKETIVPQIIEL
jgi:putative phosphoesterase